MSQDETLIVNCPNCGKSVIWNESSPWRPFCSDRCKLIDLGEWAAEEKVIQGSQLLSDRDEWSEESSKD